jgi:o-succinylbenzoate---CoA ligase
MIDWLNEAAGLFNSNDYIIYGDKHSSFIDTNNRASFLSFLLQRDYCIKRGDIVLIISDNNVDFVLLIFALWKLGAVPVPLNIRLNKTEVNTVIKFLKPAFVFLHDNIKDLTELMGETILIPLNIFTQAAPGADYSSKVNETDLMVKFSEEDTALILFTSGTSGRPKGVELSFRNLRASYINSNTVLNQQEADRWIASLPFYHIGGFSIITRALLSGASLVLPSSLRTEDLVEAINKYKPTLMSLVPTQFKRLIEMGVYPHKELKYVLLGGGHIDNAIVASGIKDCWPITKVYGSTETSSLVTFLDCIKERNKISSGGRALTNNRILIVNEEGKILPTYTPGEIAVISESCARGYYNNSEATAEKFREGIYYSGDYGYLDEVGYLFIDARRNDLIISGGENINPLEIETIILEHPGIKNALVFGEEDIEWGQIVSAAVQVYKSFSLSEEELVKFLAERISSYKIPKKIYFIEEFPLSALGKVQKEKLLEMIRGH